VSLTPDPKFFLCLVYLVSRPLLSSHRFPSMAMLRSPMPTSDAPLLLCASTRRRRRREPAPRGCVPPALPLRCGVAASPRRAMREPLVLVWEAMVEICRAQSVCSPIITKKLLPTVAARSSVVDTPSRPAPRQFGSPLILLLDFSSRWQARVRR
jgi:hypothetical protein